MVQLTYQQAITRALREEMKRDKNVLLMGQDIGVHGGLFGVTQGLLREFGPDRVMDMPVSESAMVGAAVGSAIMGMRPVAEIPSAESLACAHDLLVNYAAQSRYRWGVGVPIVVRAPYGSASTSATNHAPHPEAAYLNIPGLKVVAPSTPVDACALMKTAIRDDDPVLFLEHRGLYARIRADVPTELPPMPLGKAATVRDGKDLSIITYGAMVWVAVEAAGLLEKEGISVDVLDLRTLRPLDREAIVDSVKRTGRVMVLHEATRTGGPAGEIMAVIQEEAFEHLDAPLRRVTAPDTPVPFAPSLEQAFQPQPQDVVRVARELAGY